MAQFEYKFVAVNFLDDSAGIILSNLGDEGWRVLDSRPHPDHKYLTVVLLERQKGD